MATLFLESQEKIENAEEAINEGKWAASIYYSYQSIVNSAKALLTAEKVKVNTHASIIRDFDKLYVEEGKIHFEGGFGEVALQLNKNEPSEAFAKSYLEDAKAVLKKMEAFRKMELEHV